MRKTKIICTLGPASDTEEVIKELILAGMDVARINFSHGEYSEHKHKADTVKKLTLPPDASQISSSASIMQPTPRSNAPSPPGMPPSRGLSSRYASLSLSARLAPPPR